MCSLSVTTGMALPLKQSTKKAILSRIRRLVVRMTVRMTMMMMMTMMMVMMKIISKSDQVMGEQG